MRTSSLFLITAASMLGAQTVTNPAAMAQLAPLTVTGIAPDAFLLPGSATVLSADDFRQRGYPNRAQVAAQAPGVFVRDEDGYGNFPNLSIRGVDGTRSTKVTLMEDGILTAPSPYSAPNAYYSPKVARMAGVEFLKGSSQVMYGPHTTGGAVNFLSTPIPGAPAPAFFSRLTCGSFGALFNHTWFGATETTGAGRFGYLVEYHHQSTDGYRRIDGVGRRSGYVLTEPMLKLAWEPAGTLRQRFELKVAGTEFDADESYAGVAEADLAADPDRRYASSQFDRHEAAHRRTYLKWIAEPDASLRLESALYFNAFERTWDKVDGLTGAGLRTNVAEALMHAPSLAVLRGDPVAGNDGSFYTNAAFREHESYGWQGSARRRFEAGGLRHELTGGLRVHRDTAGGTNRRTTYAVDDGVIGAGAAGATASAGLQETLAAAVFVEDSVRLGALTLRPGVRYEHLDMANTTAAGAYQTVDTALAAGGLGFTYELTDSAALFGGVYRGTAAANPAGYFSGTRSESSLGKELGVRGRGKGSSWELVAFHTDFRDLIAPLVGVSGGGLEPSRNGGAAESYGLESLVRYDHGRARGWSFGLPAYVSATWTHARFKDIPGARLGNGAGVFAGGRDGNEIPYVPAWKLAAGVGFETAEWSGSVDLAYASATWGTGYNGDERLADGGGVGNPSAVDGRIPALLTADLNLGWHATKSLR
ncbi:MAG: TonB-dependent receptor family protein, partial [Opitutia bacterium]